MYWVDMSFVVLFEKLFLFRMRVGRLFVFCYRITCYYEFQSFSSCSCFIHNHVFVSTDFEGRGSVIVVTHMWKLIKMHVFYHSRRVESFQKNKHIYNRFSVLCTSKERIHNSMPI